MRAAPPPFVPPVQHVGRGIALRLAAVACMAVMFALVKWSSARGVPIFEIVFFRNAFAFIPLGIFIARTSHPSVLRTSRPLAHLSRAAIGLTGMICGFAAVTVLPLTEATALSFSAPLFMTALSALVLREPVGRHRWGAVAIGFVGVLIMIRPDPAHMATLGALLALGGAIGSAGAMIAIREIGKTEPGARIVFYFTLAATAVGLVGSLFGWVTPDLPTLAALVACGLIGGVGQLLLTQAVRVAPLPVIAPFDYTHLIWASLIGFLVWDEAPRPTTLLGAMVVAASGLYIVYREARGRSCALDPQERP